MASAEAPLEPLLPAQQAAGEAAARLEAAHALLANPRGVARFAARGGSEPGRPSFSAELAECACGALDRQAPMPAHAHAHARRAPIPLACC